jgi:hypothetical protein
VRRGGRGDRRKKSSYDAVQAYANEKGDDMASEKQNPTTK